MSMLLPWRKKEEWKCLQCGICCKNFYVPLSVREKNILVQRYGKKIVKRKHGEWRIRRRNGRCIFQNQNGLCQIHTTKPNTCDLFPFYVFNEPRHNLRGDKAEYWANDTCYYIYVHDFCNGFGKGRVISEYLPDVIQLWTRGETRSHMQQRSKNRT